MIAPRVFTGMEPPRRPHRRGPLRACASAHGSTARYGPRHTRGRGLQRSRWQTATRATFRGPECTLRVDDHTDAVPADPVVVVGAGPVGLTAALLLAARGLPVHVVERHRAPYPLPRAVHLDDEVFRVLQAAGVADDVLARSRPMAGLRLLDGRHRVLAEFRRSPDAGLNGWPQGSFVHQPDLEAVLASA